jgi:GrpB-like predicted nucleotidyltransferase (UPF0157 family)
MLLKEQEDTLKEIPEDAIAHVHSFDEQARTVGTRIVEDLKIALPHSTVMHLGATRIGIAGANEVDIFVISHDNYLGAKTTISSIFGEPKQSNDEVKYTTWSGSRNDYHVEVFLSAEITPRIQEFIDTQRVLEARGDLRSEFDRIKFSFDGKSLREYTKAKFEFFNRTVKPHASS